MTPGRKFYEEQIAYLSAGDADGLVDNHYAEDGVLISFQNTVRGRESLKQFFRGYLKTLGHLQVDSLDKFVESDDTVFFEATVTSDFGQGHVYDAFVLKDGKVKHHFSGVK